MLPVEQVKQTSSLGRLHALICALFISVNVLCWFPGVMTWDSFNQYRQALTGQFDDWHPPVMAWLWSWFAPISPAGSSLLILHVSLYWTALFIIAHTVRRLGRPKVALAFVGVGLLPPALVLNAFVWKDVGACVCLIFAFSLAFRAQSFGRWTLASAIPFVIAITYAFLVRSNAVFAVAPLVLYATRPSFSAKPIRLAVLSAVIIAVGFVAFGVINHKVLRATNTHALNSMIFFDVTGTSHFARSTDVFPGPVDLRVVDQCYTPQWWDSLAKVQCSKPLYRRRMGLRLWVRAAVHHPLGFVSHKIAQFNEAMFAWIPARSYRYIVTSKDKYYRPVPTSSNEAAVLSLHDKMSSMALFSPLIYLVVTVGVFSLASSRMREGSALISGAYHLSASTLFYTASYLIGGVANMYRYQYYLILGAVLAALLLWSGSKDKKLDAGEFVTVGAALAAFLLVVIAREVLA